MNSEEQAGRQPLARATLAPQHSAIMVVAGILNNERNSTTGIIYTCSLLYNGYNNVGVYNGYNGGAVGYAGAAGAANAGAGASASASASARANAGAATQYRKLRSE
ncbi:hypothetical protein PHYSODRAFT_341375 [Phytophthora sojae]|uniref:Uncharacterized protein n=1 Tax=Phytophthora sojae (strain P6497) TaxID=1094619 RepID=G5AD13_PHYSP|nr:hypothetical protein PHYSODRAFT_341375 [Phytophthora sojae]EGZ06067.1 hypothetical protein PHYSODRAFT_341375 [Phytophthora sojae]|eukprot:XP_009537964.1 hypothetical protein PHYSODRAFT_341375 [Phytophthora sojae]